MPFEKWRLKLARPHEAHDATHPITLKSLQGAEFERGMRFVKWSWACDVVVVLSLVLSVLPGHWFPWYAAVAAVSATFLKLLFTHRAAICKEAADDVRRVEMLASCLGWKLPPTDLSNLLEPFGSLKNVGAILHRICVKREPDRGPLALAHKMYERAQRSKRTYQAHANYTTTGLVGFSVVFLAACFYLIAQAQFSSAKAGVDPIVVSQVLLGVAGGDTIRGLLQATVKFRKSAHKMALLEARLGGLVTRSNPDPMSLLASVIYFFGDYNSIVESAPLTLSSIYQPIKRRYSAEPRSAPKPKVPSSHDAAATSANDLTLIAVSIHVRPSTPAGKAATGQSPA